MLSLIIKSIASLRHPAVWRIILASIFATILILFGFIGVVYYALNVFHLVNISWVESLIEGSGVLAAMFLSWLLFPVVVPAIASLFEDRTAAIIEANEYSAEGKPNTYPGVKQIGYLLLGLACNAIALPVYIIPVLNIFTYYLLNSWLLGKSMFMLVATRYHTEEGAKRLWKEKSFSIKLYGAFFVLMSNIPFLNLIAPLFSIIMMVHYSRRLQLTK